MKYNDAIGMDVSKSTIDAVLYNLHHVTYLSYGEVLGCAFVYFFPD